MLFTMRLVQPIKAGRPKRTAIDKLRTMIWFNAVSIRAGNLTAYALEHKFDGDKFTKVDGKWIRPRKWDAWKNGTRTPRRNVIDYIESQVPETVWWFDHPIWQAFDRDAIKTSRQVEDLLLRLNTIQLMLFDETQLSPRKIVRKKMTKSLADGLAHFGLFDSLAAFLIMAREAEIIASPELRELALNGYRDSIAGLRGIPELTDVASQLFWEIDISFKEWLYLKPNERMEIVVFSSEFEKYMVENE